MHDASRADGCALVGAAGLLSATTVAPTDPWTILAVTTVLLGVAAGSSYLPARRACQIDPIRALHWQ